MKEFSGVLLKFVLIGVEVLDVLIMRFGKESSVDILEGWWEREDSASTNISFLSGTVFFAWVVVWDWEEEEAECDGNCNYRCSDKGAPKLFAKVAIEV